MNQGSHTRRVNKAWSLNDAHLYVKDCYQQWGDGMIRAHHTNERDSGILFDTAKDYLSTLRAASSYNSSAFQWPSGSLGYFKCTATALRMSPPNTMVVIKSAKSIPKQFFTYRSSWRPVVEDRTAAVKQWWTALM